MIKGTNKFDTVRSIDNSKAIYRAPSSQYQCTARGEAYSISLWEPRPSHYDQISRWSRQAAAILTELCPTQAHA